MSLISYDVNAAVRKLLDERLSRHMRAYWLWELYVAILFCDDRGSTEAGDSAFLIQTSAERLHVARLFFLKKSLTALTPKKEGVTADTGGERTTDAEAVDRSNARDADYIDCAKQFRADRGWRELSSLPNETKVAAAVRDRRKHIRKTACLIDFMVSLDQSIEERAVELKPRHTGGLNMAYDLLSENDLVQNYFRVPRRCSRSTFERAMGRYRPVCVFAYVLLRQPVFSMPPAHLPEFRKRIVRLANNRTRILTFLANYRDVQLRLARRNLQLPVLELGSADECVASQVTIGSLKPHILDQVRAYGKAADRKG